MTEVDEPVGAHLDAYYVELLKSSESPVAERPKSLKGALVNSFKTPRSGVASIPTHVRFGLRAGFALLTTGTRKQSRERDAYRNRYFGEMADCQIPVQALVEIDRIAERIAVLVRRRLIYGSVLMLVRKLGVRRTSRSGPFEPSVPFTPTQRRDLMRMVSTEIDAVLQSHHLDVPAYVFGHTHLADDVELEANGRQFRCLNSGSWLNQPKEDSDAGNPENGFTFVQILPQGIGAVPTVNLMCWDDASETARAIPPASDISDTSRQVQYS